MGTVCQISSMAFKGELFLTWWWRSLHSLPAVCSVREQLLPPQRLPTKPV